jgi:hypothetical protein
MNIKEIEKINVADGDIIVFPKLTAPAMERLIDAMRKTFKGKNFLVVSLDGATGKNGRSGIRVLRLGK